MNDLLERIDDAIRDCKNYKYTGECMICQVFADCRAEIERLEQGLWDCYKASGADTDGDDTPRAVIGDLVALCVSGVDELRNDYNEALAESTVLEARIAELEKPYVPMTYYALANFWEKDFSESSVEALGKLQSIVIKRYNEQRGVK